MSVRSTSEFSQTLFALSSRDSGADEKSDSGLEKDSVLDQD